MLVSLALFRQLHKLVTKFRAHSQTTMWNVKLNNTVYVQILLVHKQKQITDTNKCKQKGSTYVEQ